MKIKSFVRFLMVLLACVSYSHGGFADDESSNLLADFCEQEYTTDPNSLLASISGNCSNDQDKAWIECNTSDGVRYICGQCNFSDTDVAIYINGDGQKICGHMDGTFDGFNTGTNYKFASCNSDASPFKGVYYDNGVTKCGECAQHGPNYINPHGLSSNNLYSIYDLGQCVNCSDLESQGFGLDQDGECVRCSNYIQDGYCVTTCDQGYVANDNVVCEKCPSDGYEWNGSCIAACPAGTIRTEDEDGAKYCTGCPDGTIAYDLGTNPRCVDSCPNGTILKTEDRRQYCELCKNNKPYSYNDNKCYASGETGETGTCPAGTIPSVDSETGGYYCKNCEDNKVAIDIYQIDENNRKTWAERECIVATTCGRSTNGLQSFYPDGKTCVPKCETENCNENLSCSGSQGLGEITNQTIGRSSSNYIKNHYGCRACTDGEMLVPANLNQVNQICTTANDSACGSGEVTWKKDGDSVPTCYTCDELNMQSGCTTSGGIFTQGKPKSGYYFEGGDSGRSKEPKFCQYKETDNPKKCWISSDDNNNCINCDTSKLIKTFDDYGPDRLYAENTTATCSAGTYIYNSECVACTGTLSNGEYKGVTADGQCGSCGDNAFVAFTCDGKGTTLYPSCNGGTITGQQCVSKDTFTDLITITQSGYDAYATRGFLDNTTNTIQLCNLSVFHPTCTNGVCINGDSDGVYGVGINGTGVTRTCEKCGEGFVSMERRGRQQCVSCGTQGPKVVNVNASGNGDGGSFSITSDVYYWRCANDCKYEGWGKNGSSCIKCADQGMRVEQVRVEQVDSQNVCEFCPDGTGWNNEKGACTACMVKLASYNGKCLDWYEFKDEINPDCKNNPNITSCNRNPFYINDENQVVLDGNNYTIQNGRVVWKGSGHDNPHRYYRERLTAGKQAWRPCSNGCCYDGGKNDVKDVTKFTMPGMACACNGIKCATSVLSCSDVLGKKREDSSTTYENRIKEILSATGYQYNPTEITLFIRDSVCNSNLKITKFCRDRNNTDSCIDFSNIKWLDVAQPSSKYLNYSTGIEIPSDVGVDPNFGAGTGTRD